MRTFREWGFGVLLVAYAWSSHAYADCSAPPTSSDGYFDQAWGNHGCVVFAGDNRDSTMSAQVEKLALTTGSNVFLGGSSSTGSGSWWIGELTDSGQFDANFGDNDGSGRVTGCELYSPATCPAEMYFDFLPQADGKALVLSNGYLTRTSVGGHALDTSVAGGTGHTASSFAISTPPGPLYGGSFGALAYSLDGRLLIAGYGNQSLVAAYQVEGIARLKDDLALDTSFHAVTDGGVAYAGGNFFATGADSQAHQLLVQSTGKLIVLGSENSRDIRVTRLNADGSLDTTFGSGGSTVLATPPAPCTSAAYSNVAYRNGAVDRADRIVVTAMCYAAPAYDTVVARLTADGALDAATFGNAGYYVSSDFAACASSQQVPPRATAIDSAGRILIAGNCGSEFAVQRLRGNGVLDTSFGDNGLAHGKFDPASNADEGDVIILDRGGRPIIGGYTQLGTRTAAVARLTYDLIYTNDLETAPRGCVSPNCN